MAIEYSGSRFKRIRINKRKDVRMDWNYGETNHKKSCILIWMLNKTSKTHILQLVDKHNDMMVCTPMSKKQLLQLSEDIQKFFKKEDTDNG